MSGALATKVCMDTNASFSKHPQIAFTYVMQRRYELREIEPWLFKQINPQAPNLPQAKLVSNQVHTDVEESKDQETNEELMARIQDWKAKNMDL